MIEITGHQVMLRLSFLSAFLRSKNIVGVRTPTIQDRLQYKASTKAFFLLMSKLIISLKLVSYNFGF